MNNLYYESKNVTCKICDDEYFDIQDGGTYDENISYSVDNFCHVNKVYTCLNCKIDNFFKTNKGIK